MDGWWTRGIRCVGISTHILRIVGSMDWLIDWWTYRWTGKRRVGERSIWRDGSGELVDGRVDGFACMRGGRAGHTGGTGGRDRRAGMIKGGILFHWIIPSLDVDVVSSTIWLSFIRLVELHLNISMKKSKRISGQVVNAACLIFRFKHMYRINVHDLHPDLWNGPR